jgi:nickel transport protein
MKHSTNLRCAATFLLFASCCNAIAHEYWIEKQGNRSILNQGHTTGAHSGPAQVPIDPAIIREVICLDPAGKALSIKPPKVIPPVVEANCAQLRFQLSSGYWTKTPYDTINKPRGEVKGALQSWLSQESVTRIEQWSIPLTKVNHPGLTLVLPGNPAALKPGDKFSVRALLDGKPAPDVTVAYDGEPRGTTDSDGLVNLRVRHGGVQHVSASIETPLKDGKADTLIRGATLNFVLP